MLLLWWLQQRSFWKNLGPVWVTGLSLNNPCIWSVSFSFVSVSLLFLHSSRLTTDVSSQAWIMCYPCGRKKGRSVPYEIPGMHFSSYRVILLPEEGKGRLRSKNIRFSLTYVKSSHKMIRFSKEQEKPWRLILNYNLLFLGPILLYFCWMPSQVVVG